MADLATLRTRLAEAEDALHRLHMGEMEVRVATGSKGVEYGPADAGKLERYIATLRSEIDRLSGARRGPILMSF